VCFPRSIVAVPNYSPSLLAQRGFPSAKTGHTKAYHLRTVPSLPSARGHTPTFALSSTRCSDHPSGHPPHIDERAMAIAVASISRVPINHYLQFSIPPSPPPRAKIVTINGKSRHIPLCNIGQHACRWPATPPEEIPLYDDQRFAWFPSLRGDGTFA